jgi:hypothetical protein
MVKKQIRFIKDRWCNREYPVIAIKVNGKWVYYEKSKYFFQGKEDTDDLIKLKKAVSDELISRATDELFEEDK